MLEPREDSDSDQSDYFSDDGEDADVTESSDSDSSSNEEVEKQEENQPLWNGNLSLEDMMQMREKVGTKKFTKDMLNTRKAPYKAKDAPNPAFKRENRNRPQEISSKIRVKQIRQVVNIPKAEHAPRDPRFDDLCGSEFDEELFNKAYAFLDDVKDREMRKLTKALQKTKSETRKRDLKYLLVRMKQQNKAKEQRAAKREMEREWKREERRKVEKGIKKPYFMTKGDKRKLLMEKRNESLKQSGHYDKMEARREKKKKSKEVKTLPFTRRTAVQ